MEHEITYLDGPYIAHVAGLTSLIERDGQVVEVVVESDGGATFIPAARVIAWERVP